MSLTLETGKLNWSEITVVINLITVVRLRSKHNYSKEIMITLIERQELHREINNLMNNPSNEMANNYIVNMLDLSRLLVSIVPGAATF